MDSSNNNDKITIGLSEIASCVTIIDMVTTRGAFKGVELSSVGMLRDRLAKYVEQNKEQDNAESSN